MKGRKAIVTALFMAACLTLPAWGEGPFQMFSPGEAVYEDLMFLAAECGPLLSFTPPLSRDEIENYLDLVEGLPLSEGAERALGRLRAALSPGMTFQERFFGLAFHPELTLNVQGRTNTAVDFPEDEAASLLTLPFRLFFADRAFLAFDPALALDPQAYQERAGHWSVNAPLAAGEVDLNVPLRAFAALGGRWWNFQIGRDRVSFGAARTGNLAVSDSPDYYDFLRISVFSTRMKYSMMISQMPFEITAPFEVTHTADGEDFNANEDLTKTTTRYLYLHRLDMQFFTTKKLSVGILEGLMVGNAPLALRYMNPLMIFHNFYDGYDYDTWHGGYLGGSMFSLELNWAFLPTWGVYGQFVMNQFATPYELENWPDTQPPNALGYLAGLEKSCSAGSWESLSYLELVYTDSYLYTVNSPFASFIAMRRLALPAVDHRYTWIGHPEGRDRLLVSAGSRLRRGPLVLEGELSYVCRGAHDLLHWDYGEGTPYNEETTPTGVPEHEIALTVAAAWQTRSWLRLSASVTNAVLLNAAHDEGQTEYGAGFSLTAVLTY